MDRLVWLSLVALSFYAWRGALPPLPHWPASKVDRARSPAGVMPARITALDVERGKVVAHYEVRSGAPVQLKHLQVSVVSASGKRSAVGHLAKARVNGTRNFKAARGRLPSGPYVAQVMSSTNGSRLVAISEPIDFDVP